MFTIDYLTTEGNSVVLYCDDCHNAKSAAGMIFYSDSVLAVFVKQVGETGNSIYLRLVKNNSNLTIDVSSSTVKG